MSPDARPIERAFQRLREELEIRTPFPPEAEREAEAAARRVASPGPDRVDRTEVPFVTIDPPGSRDLDQALRIERDGEGFRLWYAIADVGFFVDRGGAVEAEAWLRGLTVYAPDRRDPLYPPVLGQGAASLLADETRPAVLFGLTMDADANVTASTVERALVRSRAQLTYAQALEHAEGGTLFEKEEWADTLTLLKTFGELRRAREAERGGVSLPIRDQHVQHTAAARLGYELAYEEPNAAEEWNAQVSLLTGHVAALRMVEAKVGMVRTLAPAEEERVAAFRRAARALGFPWPEGTPYAAFIRSLDLRHPCLVPLMWQARRVTRGADYVAFDGEAPEDPLHHALAMPYAHVTAPLRRLADRYVLDLLVELENGKRPTPAEVETLKKLPKVMDEAERKEGRMERGAVDIAEAFLLRGRVGETFPATVLGVKNREAEVQIEDPPVRVSAARPKDAPWLDLGQRATVRLAGVDVEAGKLNFVLEPSA
ncbi:MAG TPA: RNB domain-containing ribonuclease [Longimicrobium sp.]|nr:RNB domain-containing ribonuclease [Longimicrobium sp.]